MANKTNKKEVNLKDVPAEELQHRLEKAREELFKLRFRAITAPLKNTMQIRSIKRDIARYHTFINKGTVSKNGPVKDLKHSNGSK